MTEISLLTDQEARSLKSVSLEQNQDVNVASRLPEPPGEDLRSGCFQLVEDARIPWLVAPSSLWPSASAVANRILASPHSDPSASLSASENPGDNGGPTCIIPGTLTPRGQQINRLDSALQVNEHTRRLWRTSSGDGLLAAIFLEYK